MRYRNLATWVLLLFLISFCTYCNPPEINITPIPEFIDTVTPTHTFTPEPVILTPTFTIVPSPTIWPTPTITPFPQPAGCLRPPDDLTIIQVRGHNLNVRTYAMLQHAAVLYGGVIDITNRAITQGSFTSSEPLSFGTHARGGAVDISVIDKSGERWVILEDEIEPLIYALRVSGFAAWLREYGELSPDSPIHIHAIAVGDPDLSPNAETQLTGPFGYFRGFTGIPQDNGIPIPDRHGGPILCKWMLDMGYSDLREAP